MDDLTPTDNAGDQPTPEQPVPVPSSRWTAILAAAMLGIGIAVGAAIGPAPSQSFGLGAPLGALLKTLLAAHAPAASAKATAGSPTSGGESKAASASTGGSSGESGAATPAEETPAAEGEKETGGKGGGEKTPTKAQPFYRVWVVHLSAEVHVAGGEAPSPQPAPSFPKAVTSKGSLLTGWSAIAGQNFANDVAQIAGSGETQVENVVQPACTHTQASECQAAANTFLEETSKTIEHTLLYKNGGGLIVAVFGNVEDEQSPNYQWAKESVASTLSATPPSGVLLLSPRVAAGKEPTTAFDPSAPEKAMQSLLGWKPAKTQSGAPATPKYVPPFERVWLVHLSQEGPAGFREAKAKSGEAPFINGQLASGSLLPGWSAIAGQNFASDVAQIAGSGATQLVNVIEPPCTPGKECLKKADKFLETTSAAIAKDPAYTSQAGLIVVTFGTVEAGTAQEFEKGSITSRLVTEPPTGVLLMSKRLTEPGKEPTTNFDPASPDRSMEALLRR